MGMLLLRAGLVAPFSLVLQHSQVTSDAKNCSIGIRDFKNVEAIALGFAVEFRCSEMIQGHNA